MKMTRFMLVLLGMVAFEFAQCQPMLLSDSVTLLFIGDIMGHDSQIESAKVPGVDRYDYDPVFQEVAGIIRKADFAIANLEVTLAGKPYTGYPAFSSPDDLAVACKNAGIDVLVTANNHACDKGLRGITRTIRVLDSLKIMHTGTFSDSSHREKSNLLILRKGNFRIGILNYTYGTNEIPTPAPAWVNRMDTVVMAKDIRDSRGMLLDELIVFLHWGKEYENHPSANQEEMAAFLRRQGVRIIIGSHPHVLQRMERNDGQFIAYSLGNYVSAQRTSGRDGGAMVSLSFRNSGEKLTLAQAGYYLTWVHVDNQDPARPRYQILPVAETEIRGDGPADPSAAEAMKRFARDARSLLNRENRFVDEIRPHP